MSSIVVSTCATVSVVPMSAVSPMKQRSTLGVPGRSLVPAP